MGGGGWGVGGHFDSLICEGSEMKREGFGAWEGC
jgi:hypothetical protein